MRTNVTAINTNVTHEGGRAAPAQKPLLELRRAVSSCLLFENTFYEKGSSIAARIHELAAQCKPNEVADLALHARRDLGLRHVSLWLALALVPKRKPGQSSHWPATTDAIANVIQRPDELTEILAMYWREGKHPIAAPLKRALRRAFGKFTPYQIAKWNRADAIKLVDVLFMVHPEPIGDEQVRTYRQLVDGTLPAPDTWEVALSGGADKRATWIRLLEERKLGGLAMLRNLRNMEQAKVPLELISRALVEGAAGQELDEARRPVRGLDLYSAIHIATDQTAKEVKRSPSIFRGVQPWQILSAAIEAPWAITALDPILTDRAAQGEKIKGMTLVVVDVSGSMYQAKLSEKGDRVRADAAACLAVHLREACEMARFWTFSNELVEVPGYRGLGLVGAIHNSQQHGNTMLVQALVKLADIGQGTRIVVITDEQTHDGFQITGPSGYLVNVAPYKPALAIGGGWTRINGWSDRLVDFIRETEALEAIDHAG